MPNVSPMLHMDQKYMWRWYAIDDQGQTAFLSPRTFFSHEKCRQDYAVAMQSFKPPGLK